MATKNIAITQDAYDLLCRYKRPNESFSEVIRAHFKKKSTLLDFAGIWSDMTDKEIAEFRKGIEESRKRFDLSVEKKIRGLRDDRRR